LGGVAVGFDVNFLTGVLDPRITFTRSTIATYTGSDGLVKTAAINEPRFDYDPTTLQPRGLLIEESRTNIVLHSSDLTQTAWVKVNATVAMTATGPDGADNSATTVTATAGNATVLQAFVLANAQRNTSVYIKRRTGTGTIQITQTGGTTWTTVTVTSGWTRVSLPGGNVVNPSVGLRIVTSGDAVDVALFQCEVGGVSALNIPTSAIPTGASQVTRTADVALVTGTNFSSWYNQTEGTMVAAFSSFAAATNSQSVYAVSNGSALTRWSADLSTGVQHNVSVTTSQASITVGTFATNTIYKSAFGVKLNSMQAAVNNVQGTEDTVGTMPTVNRLSIGSSAGANNNFLVGHIRSLTYYPTRLTNAELQALTV
jgi:hypothetical protein